MINKKNAFDLNLKWHLPEANRYVFTFITLFVALIIIYGNSFHCGWHFDDYPNIVDNSNSSLELLSWENIKKVLYVKDYEEKGISRPLVRLTFAFNYYIGGANVFGYHVVNFIVHYLASLFLFLLLINTLKLPMLKGRYDKTAYAISLLSVFFWATHPIQVTAVTYIVQRMASMAGMFYIISMYFYLKARTINGTKRRFGFFVVCGLAAICSFACKENAFMLPISILFYDLFLIQGWTWENLKKVLKFSIIPLLIVLSIALYYSDPSTILDEYQIRPFSLSERLMTEPRVILYYISLLLYPVSSRLTLIHDFAISRSLFTPWTTLPAILIILIFIVSAIMISRKRPLISYCILFYFLNHFIEGSFIPLELVFEHTNYLPSIFIFVPIAIFAVYVVDYFSYRKSIQFFMSFMIVFLLAAQGDTTYLRNSILQNGITLWTDNIEKSPDLPRVHHNLGAALLTNNFYKEGLFESQKAIDCMRDDKTHQRYKTHFNLGTFYLAQSKYDKALAHLYKTLEYHPNYPRANNKVAIIMIYKNDLNLALKYCSKAIKLDPDSAEFYRTLSLILLKKGETDDAIRQAIKAMHFKDNENRSYYFLGEAYRIKNELKRSVFYFKKHLEQFPDHIPANIALIELYYLINKQDDMKQNIFKLISLTKGKKLSGIIYDYHMKYNCLDFSRIERVANAVENVISQQFTCLVNKIKEQASKSEKKAPGRYMLPDADIYYEK